MPDSFPFYQGQLDNGYAPVAGYSNSKPGLNQNTPTPSVYNPPAPTPAKTSGTSGAGVSTTPPAPIQNATTNQNDDPNAFGPNLLPRVTPTSSSTPSSVISGTSLTPAVPQSLSTTPTIAPPTEEQNYATLLDRANKNISDVTKSYSDEINSANAASSARVNAAGLGGSSAGGEIYTEAQQTIIDARNKALDDIYQNIQTNALNLTQLSDSEASTASAEKEQIKTDAQESIKTMAAAHLDWNNYKQTNPDNYNALVQSLGGDPNVADSLFAMSAPPETVTNQYNVNDGNGGTTVNQIVQDPVTGAIRHTKYDLPGVNIPPTYTYQKSGTNSGYYVPSDFAQNPDVSKLIFISSDPTNNGAITVTQNGSTTVNGIPINNNPSNTSSLSGSTTQSGGAAPTVASLIGIDDPAQPLSSVLNNVNVGLDGVVNGIIANEGGSPKGVINNPGNIKFVGLPGQTDSGVQATDGGSFASYSTKQQGMQAIGDLVTKASDSGSSFSDFINSYTGTTPSNNSIPGMPLGISQDQISKAQNYANDILNGNITSIASVPKGMVRDATAAILANPVNETSYSPLSASRFTNAANRIVSNYINMPAYQLTAGGQLYLGRINAAMQNPGSISDQDLLDSLTKLNTGGNAISDAQVSLITGGKSFADTANTLSNKLKNGGVLSDSQRQQVQSLAEAIFKSYQTAYEPVYKQATTQLQEAGIPKPFWTIPDLNTLTSQSGTDDSGSNNSIISRTDMTQQGARDFVENTLVANGLKYDDIISQYTPTLQKGEKLALDNSTGAIIAVSSSDDPTSYTTL